MGVSDGVWECGKPKRFSIISMPQSEGEKGEVTFSLLRHKLHKAAASVVSGLVAVKAEGNGLDVRTVREETQQGFFSHTAQ